MFLLVAVRFLFSIELFYEPIIMGFRNETLLFWARLISPRIIAHKLKAKQKGKQTITEWLGFLSAAIRTHSSASATLAVNSLHHG